MSYYFSPSFAGAVVSSPTSAGIGGIGSMGGLSGMQHLGHTLTSPVYITSQPVISESTLTESISSPILSVPNLNLIQSTSATLLPPTLTLSSSLFLFLQVRQAIETIDQAWMRQQQQQQLLLQQQSQQPQDDDSRGDSDDIVDIGGEGAEGGLSSSTRSLRSQTSHPPILIPPNKVPIHPLILRLPLHLLQLACAFNDDLLTHLLAFPLSSPLPLPSHVCTLSRCRFRD